MLLRFYQVKDLKCEFTGVRWQGTGDNEIKPEVDTLLPINDL